MNQNIHGQTSLLDPSFIIKSAGIKDGFKVADFGCGATGHFIFPTSRTVGNRGTVYAIDILKSVLESISRRANEENISNIKTVWSDIEVYNATSLETASLDVGLLINNLCISKKRPEVLRETIRMIKKNGRLLVVEWDSSSAPIGPSSEKKVNPELLKKAGEKLGLKVEDYFPAGKYHYGVLFTKL